jgi:hypothetical protein
MEFRQLRCVPFEPWWLRIAARAIPPKEICILSPIFHEIYGLTSDEIKLVEESSGK